MPAIFMLTDIGLFIVTLFAITAAAVFIETILTKR
jgi:hypothetical protein